MQGRTGADSWQDPLSSNFTALFLNMDIATYLLSFIDGLNLLPLRRVCKRWAAAIALVPARVHIGGTRIDFTRALPTLATALPSTVFLCTERLPVLPDLPRLECLEVVAEHTSVKFLFNELPYPRLTRFMALLDESKNLPYSLDNLSQLTQLRDLVVYRASKHSLSILHHLSKLTRLEIGTAELKSNTTLSVTEWLTESTRSGLQCLQLCIDSADGNTSHIPERLKTLHIAFPALRRLSLTTESSFTNLSAIMNMTHITDLRLHVPSSGLEEKHLPTSIFAFSRLESLMLRNVLLPNVPPASTLPRLVRFVYCSGEASQLSWLAQFVEIAPKLQSVFVKVRWFQLVSELKIECLTSLRKLKHLSITSSSLPDYFSKLTALETLHLPYVDLQQVPSIIVLTRLKHLHIMVAIPDVEKAIRASLPSLRITDFTDHKQRLLNMIYPGYL